MTKPIKVVYFGTEDLSTPTLQALINDDHYQVVAVVTKPDAVRGRGHKLQSPEVAELARQHDITVLQPAKLLDITNTLADLQPDIGALVSYGKIIPQSIIDLFPRGIINFHPSMLPVYRGPSPIETSLANGDSFTGATLIALSAQMDAGDIYYQEKIAINPDATASDMYNLLSQRGAELMVQNLIKIAHGELKSVPQDDSLAIYCQIISKSDGQLDPSTMTARECYNRLRAYQKWPRCRLQIDDQNIIITAAKPLDNFTGDSWPDIIPCADNSALQITEIISPKSGQRMSLTSYLNGQMSQK